MEVLKSVLRDKEFLKNLTVKPEGTVEFREIISLPLWAAGRGPNVRLG
jgi:hypothetical protein